jgi:hypothetical protein
MGLADARAEPIADAAEATKRLGGRGLGCPGGRAGRELSGSPTVGVLIAVSLFGRQRGAGGRVAMARAGGMRPW